MFQSTPHGDSIIGWIGAAVVFSGAVIAILQYRQRSGAQPVELGLTDATREARLAERDKLRAETRKIEDERESAVTERFFRQMESLASLYEKSLKRCADLETERDGLQTKLDQQQIIIEEIGRAGVRGRLLD